jgi:hypothetical protein
MTFKLRIPGRLEVEAPPVANPANPLIGHSPFAANDGAAAGRVSRLAELASDKPRDTDRNNDHETEFERSAILSADGAPYCEADGQAGLPAWTDAEIVAFDKRVARSVWHGYADAKGRAERLLRRDRSGDHRRLCPECTYARPGWRCAKGEAFLTDQLQTCPLFKEHLHEPFPD